MLYTREARVDQIDESGRFSMTLVTEGEASDGHILNVAGGHLPERMPLLVSHWNDPSGAAGSVTEPEKRTKDKPPRVRAVGQIEMEGEGAPAEIRRDLAFMIQKGHVGAVSVRWDEVEGKPPVRRVNLPSDHPYYVDAETERGSAKRWGYYFEEWRAMEGSIVALGADPGALIGRAEETTGAVRSFWRSQAAAAEASDLPAALEALRIHAQECIDLGADPEELVRSLAVVCPEIEIRDPEAGDVVASAPTDPETTDPEARSQTTPEPPAEPEITAPQPATERQPATTREAWRPSEVAETLREELDRRRAGNRAAVEEILDRATGRI